MKLQRNKNVITVNKDTRGNALNDGLCFFRCLAVTLDESRKKPSDYARSCTRMARELNERFDPLKRETFTFDELPRAEEVFNVRIVVIQKNQKKEGTYEIRYKSSRREGKRMDLLLISDGTQGHFCLITNLACFVKCYSCRSCGTELESYASMHQHEKHCLKKVRYEFETGTMGGEEVDVFRLVRIRKVGDYV